MKKVNEHCAVARSVLYLCLVLFSASVHSESLSGRLAQVPLPTDARLRSVGLDMQHNGNSLAVVQFQAPQPVAETVAFYQSAWERAHDDRPAYVENTVGDWLVLSYLDGDVQIVLQLQASEPSTSVGYLSAMPIKPTGTLSDLGLQIPGLERLSMTQSRDTGMQSDLSVYRSTDNQRSLTDRLLRLWKDDNWTLVSQERHEKNTVLLLNRQSERLDVVLTESDGQGVLLVVNRVEEDA